MFSKELGANTKGCLTLDCYERAWKVKLKAPNEHQLDLSVIVIYMGILALTIAVVISVVIVMPIRIKLQFAKIECNMIQILVY